MTKKHRRQRLSVPLSWRKCFMTWTSDNASYSQCHFRLLFSLGTVDELNERKPVNLPCFKSWCMSYHMSQAEALAALQIDITVCECVWLHCVYFSYA